MDRNYISIVKAVWKKYCSSILEPNDYCLMMRLIAISNDDMGWGDCFMRNNHELCGYLKLSYKQLQNSRNKLQQLNLISFEQRNGLSNCKYKIHYDALLDLSNKSEGDGKVRERLGKGDGVLKNKPNVNKNETKEEGAADADPPPKDPKIKKFKIENFLRPEILPFSSEEFISVWQKLLESPKWRKKNELAIELTIIKMQKYNEPFIIQQIECAIVGQWQGLFFQNTDADYQKFINNGNTGINNNNSKSTISGVPVAQAASIMSKGASYPSHWKFDETGARIDPG